jgi:hypothetical protein
MFTRNLMLTSVNGASDVRVVNDLYVERVSGWVTSPRRIPSPQVNIVNEITKLTIITKVNVVGRLVEISSKNICAPM